MGIQYLNTYMKNRAKEESIIKTNLNNLENKIIAVDTSIYLYRFLSEDSLLENMYLMISLFKYYKIIPIFVFDGKPPKEKLGIIEKRNNEKNNAEIKCNQLQQQLTSINDINKRNDIIDCINSLKKKCIRLKYTDIISVRNLLDAFGVYYIEALGEADELCAKLVIKRYAYACLSEDMDLFLYGCPRVMRYLSLANQTVILYHLDKILLDLNLTFEEFKNICILSGTDYNVHLDEQINIYGALKLFGKYKKKNGNDFFQWLSDNNRISDYTKLTDVYKMFDVYTMNIEFSKSKFRNKFYNSDDVKNIMQRNGFIYMN